MKEVYLILSHTPSFEKQQMLRQLVHSINKQGKEVMVISHTQIPKDIEDMCDYTIFDKENKLAYNADAQFWSYTKVNDKKFEFLNLKSAITILPVYKLLIGGVSYLKALGYDIIHLLEYDCEISDFSHFNNVNENITQGEYDIIGFKQERDHEQKHLLLPISFNVKKLSFDDLSYDEDFLLSDYKRRFRSKLFPITECLVYDNLWSKLNVKIEDSEEIKATMKINQNYTLGLPDKYCLHTVDGVLHLTHDNLTNKEPNLVDVTIYTKDGNNKVKSFLAPYYRCLWVNLGVNYEDAVYIKIFVNNTIFRELDLRKQNDRAYIETSRIITE
jgi:hypothetical protein